MANVGVFFGSDGGNSKDVANKIAAALGATASDISKSSASDLAAFDNLVLITPTYGAGDPQSDWEDFLGGVDGSEFDGKVVGIVSIGDQELYSDTFAEGGAHIYAKVANHAKVVGATSVDGYEFEASAFVDGGKFLGLVLDEDNQSDESDERIAAWVEAIKGEFK